MMTAQQSEINLTRRQRAARRRISRNNPPPQQGNEPQEDALTFVERLKKTLAVLKWLKEAVATLTWLKALMVSLFGVGVVFYSSSDIKPLSKLFPQADAGRQFLWAHPENAVKAGFDSGCAKPKLTNLFGFIGASSGLRLQYGVVPNMQDGGWGVHWDDSSTKHFDASGFDHFSFWVRGVTGDELFEIGLKDTNAKEIKIESKDWVSVNALKDGDVVIIPLTEFKDVNTKLLNNVSFGFNAHHGSGTICIDGMAFGRQSSSRA
ncbi:MAG: hypothetical protein U1F42_08320 [Candidatus Competibacteraceae bacterium]